MITSPSVQGSVAKQASWWEKRTGERIPVPTMVKSLRKAHLVQLEDETFVNAYCDNAIEAIGKAFALDLTKKYYTKGELKALRGKTAKGR